MAKCSNPETNLPSGSSDLEAGGSNVRFDAWVRSHGGDEQFISIFHSHLFQSISSLGEFDIVSDKNTALTHDCIICLGNLDMNSSDSSELVEELNCGQCCFLRGLVQASKS